LYVTFLHYNAFTFASSILTSDKGLVEGAANRGNDAPPIRNVFARYLDAKQGSLLAKNSSIHLRQTHTPEKKPLDPATFRDDAI
jgi:hypothetical protein